MSATAATRYTRGATTSGVRRLMRLSNTIEPIMTATMKLEKIQPNGSVSSSAAAAHPPIEQEFRRRTRKTQQRFR